MATWTKIGVKGNDSMDFNSKDASDSDLPKSNARKASGAKEGSPSLLSVSGAEYSYSALTNRVTMKILSVQNKSGSKTGSLRFELFMSKDGPYSKGAKLSGFTMAVSNTYEPLWTNSAYTNITSTVLASNKKSGSWQPVILVRELNSDGEWHIAAYANFAKKEKLI